MALAFVAGDALAADPPLETADGRKGCDELEQKNDRELKTFVATQAPVPYKFQTPDNVLGSPWGGFFKWFGGNLDLIAATLIPSFGAQFRVKTGTPLTAISWPWSFPIGPWYACSRRQGSFVVNGHKIHRLMLEPGFVVGSNELGAGGYARVGYRFLWHPTDWVVGPGIGVGSTGEVGVKEPIRASVSPELLARFGHCCEPSYFILFTRGEFFFAGTNKVVFQVGLGYTFL
jgi:hypothetical protein